ncbi:MAG: DNA recombination protein RmuC [Chitinophagaceae bacterium]|nr:MAG: DNA recombination protein RmuC [Chitinophagaceae bacterium]
MAEVLISFCLLLILVIIYLLFGKKHQKSDNKEIIQQLNSKLSDIERSIREEMKTNRTEAAQYAQMSRDELAKSLNQFGNINAENSDKLNKSVRERFEDFNKMQQELNIGFLNRLKDISERVEKDLESIRKDNNEQLTEMRKTVDEKLQTALEKRLGESFKQVSDRLEQVHKGLGEMQSLANGVGDLKRVLSNVKTRGVMGEYQLENILEQLLTPDQFSKNVATKKGSHAFVEFAVKLPGRAADEGVWMPIDSKFPTENYQFLLDAYDEGDKIKIDVAQKGLIKSIELSAKEISAKYIDPPHTTDFAIMFLPIEGLYAEVLRHSGLFEKLQRTYRITITGPTTLSALLNSLQMGFRTLAVQKRSSEVWKILEAVKTEFDKFGEQLEKVDKQLHTASKSLDELRNTRTNVMSRKLKDIGTLDTKEAEEILKLPKKNEGDD